MRFPVVIAGFIFISLHFTAITLNAQKRTELEKEKKENLRKIQETNKILNETRNQKSASLGQLSALQEQIKERNRVIATIEKEVNLINEEVFQIESNISSLETNLGALRKEYSLMIYTAYKTSNDYDKLTFLFSSQTFNQLVMRLKYFAYYSQSRQTQVKQIKKVATSLRRQRQSLYRKRREKKDLIQTQVIENNNLQTIKKQQDEVVAELSKKEKQLLEELEERRKALDKLERLIRDLIKNEMAKAVKSKSAATPEATHLSSSFSGNKSKLIWPVKHGFVSQRFGKQKHPVLKNVEIENLGIDIQTNKDEPVRAVFDGKVVAVASVPGMQEVVMIQHGDYYTFYAKLKNVLVQTGQKIKAKEDIGEVVTDKEDIAEVQFQIWKGNDKLDPEDWLLPK